MPLCFLTNLQDKSVMFGTSQLAIFFFFYSCVFKLTAVGPKSDEVIFFYIIICFYLN